MKKLLNTLYITRQESYLHKERETIVIKQGKEKLGQFPAININNIYCFGQVSVSPFLMGYCAENSINLTFYTEYGRYLANVIGKPTGNVLLRREQFRWADSEEKSTDVARNIVAAKIANSRAVLQREIRNHGINDEISKAAERLAISCRRAKAGGSLDEVRGIEGEAAAVYFSVLNELVRNPDFEFSGRVRRPPTDPVNAMLSFAYSIQTQECAAALAGVGLDPYVGFLHRDRPGRPGLALDLLEEFRAPLADRFVLTILNRKQVKKRDFVSEASGAVTLTDDARRAFLTAFQDRKREEIEHPYLKESVPLGLLPHCQAQLLARHLRGDTELYAPFTTSK